MAVLPSHGAVCGETPRPMQTESSWIATEIAAISDLFVKTSTEYFVFMGVLCIPRLACVAGTCGAYVATVTAPISIETICNKR